MIGRIFGYARVSTDQQDIETQKEKLEKLGALVVFSDVASGSTLSGRSQLDAALKLLEPLDQLVARCTRID